MSLSVVQDGQIKEHEPQIPRILIVSGSRQVVKARKKVVWDRLDAEHGKHPVMLLVEGGATGVDRYAREWGLERGVPPITVWALWPCLDKAAGADRNERMLAMFPDAHVVAFPAPDSVGTTHMIALAVEQERELEVCEL